MSDNYRKSATPGGRFTGSAILLEPSRSNLDRNGRHVAAQTRGRSCAAETTSGDCEITFRERLVSNPAPPLERCIVRVIFVALRTYAALALPRVLHSKRTCTLAGKVSRASRPSCHERRETERARASAARCLEGNATSHAGHAGPSRAGQPNPPRQQRRGVTAAPAPGTRQRCGEASRVHAKCAVGIIDRRCGIVIGWLKRWRSKAGGVRADHDVQSTGSRTVHTDQPSCETCAARRGAPSTERCSVIGMQMLASARSGPAGSGPVVGGSTAKYRLVIRCCALTCQDQPISSVRFWLAAGTKLSTPSYPPAARATPARDTGG